ncbi:exopolysaccharide biosynthesis polyprenyl glycosylphosphotransferase [Aquipuribacter nitratireducens]|uniref:Sugar transferase n=1 Tax=Aquipuribacter nitratireducens TaxID=650104 RepID=A0ABW0GSS9_9MICO
MAFFVALVVGSLAPVIVGQQAVWNLAGPLSFPVAVLLASVLVAAVWVCALGLGRAYENRFLVHGASENYRVSVSGVVALAVMGTLGWLVLPQVWAPVGIVGVALVLGLTLLSRSIMREQLQRRHAGGVTRRRVLVVGEPQEAVRLAARIHRNRYHGWHVVAAAEPGGMRHAALDTEDGLLLLDPVSGPEDVVLAAARSHADLVLVAPSGGARLTAIDVLERALHAEGREVALAPPMVEAVGPRVSLEAVCGLPVVHLSPPELGGPRRFVKALGDRFAAGLALLVLSPVFLVVGLAIRLDSPGPALFRQVRVGRNGRPFTILKFRTMHADAEARLLALVGDNEGAGPLFKMQDDPRVTRVGRFLRRTSLDELPQLLNVALGSMSVVGPRPPLPSEVEEYDATTMRRLLVPPGITGLWQVNGRSDLSWEESTRLDVRYVENWSLGFDLRILARTVVAVLQARGAY